MRPSMSRSNGTDTIPSALCKIRRTLPHLTLPSQPPWRLVKPQSENMHYITVRNNRPID